MKLYFAYGANLNHAGMRLRCPGARPLAPFYLRDYRLTFSGVASIQPARGQEVPGALWAITPECEQALDRFEGYPYMYRKEYFDWDDYTVMFYRMNSELPGEPASSYLETIAQGYHDFGLPLEMLEQAVLTTQQEVEQDQASSHRITRDHEPDLAWLRDAAGSQGVPW